MRVVLGTDRGTNCSPYSTTDDSTMAPPDFVTDRGACCATNATANRCIQSRIIRIRLNT
jgi:hypothetical protein